MNKPNAFRVSLVLAVFSLGSLAGIARAERELSSDRPDATESPFTVEPKRVQLEASFVQFTRDRHNADYENVRVNEWAYAPLNVRVGLTPHSEVQFVFDGYVDAKAEEGESGASARVRGFGDTTLRVKWNFWGNDGGETALGLMPFVKLPTGDDELGNDSVEGGVILPFAMELGQGWGFGAMTEIDIVRNGADDGYESVWVNTATVSHDLTEKLGFFVEVASEVGQGKPVLTGNAGLTYAVNKDLQLDLGVNVGLTRSADDFSVFSGFVQRF
jgi:hypothetical protein